MSWSLIAARVATLAKRAAVGLVALLALAAAVVVGCEWAVTRVGRQRLYRDLARVPAVETALVLGTSRLTGEGRPNAYFQARMEAAAALFHAGKVRRLILSGKGIETGYDEPKDMRRALVALRVPSEALTLDRLGVRTIDSVLRAERVYRAAPFVIVSQGFHDERALFLCRAYGVEATAFDANAVRPVSGHRIEAREVVARLLAVWEGYVARR